MSSERIACKQCGKWMFHLAVKCPHCGAPQSANASAPDEEAPVPKVKEKKPELKLSAEEARALLAAEEAKDPRSGSSMTFAALAQELVMWRDGVPDVVLSVLAFPVTGATVISLGYLLLRVRRSQRDEALAGITLMAVPIGAAMLALTLWELDTPMAGWLAFAGGFAAWLARSVLRTLQKKDSLL
jgi:uncharacterized Zn finger protein (UPF0148 family)